VKRALVLTVGLLAASTLAAQAPPDTAARLPLDSAVRLDTLPNGIVSYVRVNREPEKRAELRLVLNAGSVLEDDDQRGLAHVVEHMAFNGTRRFPKQTLVDFLERVGMRFGAHVNAYTSFDETVYHFRVPTDTAGVLERGFDILFEWASAVAFEPDEVERERGVVIEEWRLGLGAQDRIFKKELPELLRGSRYAERLPIGTHESLRSFTRDLLLRFYRDWYRADLLAVVAVGDFDADSVAAMIRQRFAAIPRPEAVRPRPAVPSPLLDSSRVLVTTDPELPYSGVSVSLRRPRRPLGTVGAFRDALVWDLGQAILNARLSELTQRANPPFIGAFFGRQQWTRTVEFVTLAAAVGDGGIERGLEALVTEAERTRRHGFTATELARAKDDLLRGYEQAWAERDKTPSERFAASYQSHFLEASPVPGAEAEYRLAEALLLGIGLEEVNGIVRAGFTSADRVVLANAPEKPGLTAPAPAALALVIDRVVATEVAAYEDNVGAEPLVPDPPSAGRIVEERADERFGTRTWTLQNGVRVILKPTDFKADEVLVTAYSPGGTSLAPDSLYLNAWLAPAIMGVGGLGAFDQVTLQKKLAGKVASVTPMFTRTQEGLSGSASPKDLETLFQLIYLTLTAPRADTTAFEALLANGRAGLANRGADPEQVYEDTVQVTLTQHHPRARPLTMAILDSLDLDKAHRFYRERFADASDFTFVFVGAFQPDSIRPLVERWLGSLPALRRGERWRDAGIRPPRGLVERTVRRGLEPKSQTRIVFGGPFEYTRPNRVALRALARVLEIRLRENLREALGGTYGASASASVAWEPIQSYVFTISFGSAPERAEELTRAAFAIVDSLRTAGPREDDLQKVREAEIRSRQTALRENEYWLSVLSQTDQQGEDPSPALAPRGDVEHMTAERIRNMAARYLDPSNHIRVTLMPEREGQAR